MNIFITGIRGFLGSHLRAWVEAEGHRVHGGDPQLRLGDPLPAPPADAEALIHCAHDFHKGSELTNVEGFRDLFLATEGMRRIFVSSHSARPDAVTEYGIAKYRIEQFWQGDNAVIVRPGLVIGPGGRYAQQMRLLRKLPHVPVVDYGRDPVAVLPLEEFSAAIGKLLKTGTVSEYNLFITPMPTMRELVRKEIHAPIISIPDPSGKSSNSGAESEACAQFESSRTASRGGFQVLCRFAQLT